MARLRLEIEIPGYTAEELRNLVAAIDEAESGPGEGISAELVSAADVLSLIYGCDITGYGVLPFMEAEITEALVEGLDREGIEVPKRPIPQLQYFRILQDEMWD